MHCHFSVRCAHIFPHSECFFVFGSCMYDIECSEKVFFVEWILPYPHAKTIRAILLAIIKRKRDIAKLSSPVLFPTSTLSWKTLIDSVIDFKWKDKILRHNMINDKSKFWLAKQNYNGLHISKEQHSKNNTNVDKGLFGELFIKPLWVVRWYGNNDNSPIVTLQGALQWKTTWKSKQIGLKDNKSFSCYNYIGEKQENINL